MPSAIPRSRPDATVRTRPRPCPIIVAAAAAAVLTLAPAPARATGGGTFFNVDSIENSKQRIWVVRAGTTEEPNPQGAIAVAAIEDVATHTFFETALGPVFSVELRSLTDPAGHPPVLVPPTPVDTLLLRPENLRVTKTSSQSLRLEWLAIPVPGTEPPQTVDVTATIRLRTDKKSEWDVTASVTPGPYGVYAVRYPFFAMAKIGSTSADDRLVSPFSSGLVLDDPVTNGNTFPERDPLAEGSVVDAFFTYPGSIFTQFMAYYDTGEAGLFMQAEDTRGTTKNLYFNAGNSTLVPEARRAYWHITHFNTAPSVASGATAEERDAAYRSFSLVSELGYPVVLDTFQGDWVDATAIYRNWVTAAEPFFLSRGTLAERVDMDPAVKVIPWAFRYQFALGSTAINVPVETETARRILRFYREVFDRFDPARTLDLDPIILAARYSQTLAGGILPDVASDDFQAPLRPGVPEWLHAIRFPEPGEPSAQSVALNQDTTGFDSRTLLAPEATRNGVMFTSRFLPMVPRRNFLRACVGSEWLLDHRADIVVGVIGSSFHAGEPGFTMAGLSGTGNFAFPCFAPAIESPSVVDATLHDHTIGGGDFIASGWTDLAAIVRDRALAEFGVAPLIMGMEHEPETAIRDYLLNGRSFAAPYDDSTPGIGRTVTASQPVPIFKLLYHDFNLWTARIPAATNVVSLYVDETHPLGDLLLIRFRTAQLAMMGRLLLVQFSQDPALATLEAPPDAIPAELQDEHRYAAAMSVLRVSIPDYLVFGRALRDPEVLPATAADSVAIRTIFEGVERVDSVPRAVASAWIDDHASGKPGLILTNFTSAPTDARVRFRPSDYGLDRRTRYKLQKRTLASPAWTDVAGFSFKGDVSSVSTPVFRIAPLEDETGEPWVILRIVRQ